MCSGIYLKELQLNWFIFIITFFIYFVTELLELFGWVYLFEQMFLYTLIFNFFSESQYDIYMLKCI